MAESDRSRITRLARRLRLALWVAILLSALLYVAARMGFSAGNFQVVMPTGHWVPGLVRDLSIVMLYVALWQLTLMLRLVERGERFSPPVTRHFRRFALFLLVAASVQLAAPLAALLFAGRTHRLEIPLNFRDLWTMLITGVLFLVARLLDEAQRIQTEVSEFV
jgi:hypothetical protein